ncbi:MAG: aminoglycoside phosphotransferase family protein [Acidobacteriia bacterium]|nr:aminoglycoside phosphotransferase family protein [Terriglobia bacterium]
MDKCTASLSGPIGWSAGHSAHPGVVSLLNQFPSTHHTVQLAAQAHSIGASPVGAVFLFLMPLLAMCAVRVPLPEALFNSDFRARLGSIFSEHHSIADLTIQPMRRRPGSRHVFAYKLLVADKRTGKQNVVELVGKQDTTRAVGKAAKEFEAMRLLWGAGFGQDHQFRIPQPLHHFEDLRMIIQEKARGTKLRSFLGDGNDISFNHARMTGQWLAKLHNMPLESLRECAYEAEKASLRTFVDALKNDQPQLESELRQYAAAIEQRFDLFQGVAATHVHGDFHPDHVYVANNFVTVIDFERFCIGDPARDLGSFVGHMRTTAYSLEKSIEFADREIDAFLESYFGAMPEALGNAISARVAPYAALSSLEALYYVASVLKVTNPARVAMYMQCVRESGVAPAEAEPPDAGTRKASA